MNHQIRLIQEADLTDYPDCTVEKRLEAMLPVLYRVAYGLTGNSADAEDIAHDTCVKALSTGTGADLKSDYALNSWVRVIMINIFRDNYRREKKSPIRQFFGGKTSDDEGSILDIASSPDPSPEDWAVFRNLESETCKAVANLPEDIRVVIVLAIVDNNSYRQVAGILDIPIGTVMSRLSRGRSLLRKAIKYDTDPNGQEVAQ